MRIRVSSPASEQPFAGYSHFRPRRWQPAPQLPPMPAAYAALYQAAFRSRHEFFASREGRRYHVPLARNRAIWCVRRWLKCYREGERTAKVVAEIADCMAIIAVLSSQN